MGMGNPLTQVGGVAGFEGEGGWVCGAGIRVNCGGGGVGVVWKESGTLMAARARGGRGAFGLGVRGGKGEVWLVGSGRWWCMGERSG